MFKMIIYDSTKDPHDKMSQYQLSLFASNRQTSGQISEYFTERSAIH